MQAGETPDTKLNKYFIAYRLYGQGCKDSQNKEVMEQEDQMFSFESMWVFLLLIRPEK